MARRSRSPSRDALGLLAVLAAWVVSSNALAAPLTATYAITGGETFGGFLGNAPIRSGTVLVSMRNTGSGPPPIRTFDPTFALQLTATSDATRFLHLGCCFIKSASYGPAQADRFTYFGFTDCEPDSCGWRLLLSVSIGGKIVNGSLTYSRTDLGTGDETFSFGVRNIVGREIPVPEPSPGALGSGALLAAAGAVAGTRVARWATRRLLDGTSVTGA